MIDVRSPAIATPAPILLAGMLIFSAAGQILLIQENYGRYAYGLPGGHVELNESPLAAAVREVAEETGLQAQADRVLAFYSFANPEPCLACVFLGSVIGGQLTLPSDGEIAAVSWFEPERLPHPINTTAVYALQDAIRLLWRHSHADHLTAQHQPPTPRPAAPYVVGASIEQAMDITLRLTSEIARMGGVPRCPTAHKETARGLAVAQSIEDGCSALLEICQP